MDATFGMDAGTRSSKRTCTCHLPCLHDCMWGMWTLNGRWTRQGHSGETSSWEGKECMAKRWGGKEMHGIFDHVRDIMKFNVYFASCQYLSSVICSCLTLYLRTWFKKLSITSRETRENLDDGNTHYAILTHPCISECVLHNTCCG